MAENQRRVGVIILLGCGMVFAAAGLGLLWWSFQLTDRSALDLSAAESLCQKRLRSLGTLSREGDHLKLVVAKVASPRVAMEDASALPAVCPGWTVSYFCLGIACGDGPAVKMIAELAPVR